MPSADALSARISRLVVDHPWRGVALVLFALVLSLLQIHTLEIDSSTQGLIDETDPRKAFYDEFKDVFGSDTLTVVAISPPTGDVFNTETLTLIRDLTDTARSLPGVTSVQSLTSVRNIRGDGDFLSTDPLIESVPESPEDLALLHERTLANPTYLGNLVSEDARFAAVNIYTDRGQDEEDGAVDHAFQASLEAAMQTLGGEHELYQAGVPRFNVQLNRSVARDQKTLLPASVLVIFGVLTLTLRTPIAVIVPMITGGLSIAMTVGFMAWMGYSVGVLSVVVPSILIVVGCTEDVHLISKYLAELAGGKDKKDAIAATMRRGFLAVSLTSLTTVVGFAALSLNDIRAVREFGIICCFGLAANYVVTMIMVPGTLLLMKAPRPTPNGGPGGPGRISRALDALLSLAVRVRERHQPAMAVTTIALVLLAAWGCTLLEVNNDPITYFKADHPFRADAQRLHRDLAGAQSFHVVFETEDEGDIQEPEVLALIADLQAFLEQTGHFDRSLSLVDFVRLVHREMNTDPAFFRVPESRGTIAEYILLLEDEELFRYVDYERRRSSIAVRHNLSGSAETKRALAEVEAWLDERSLSYVRDGEARQIAWDITGDPILLHNATDAMIRGQMRGLALAVVAVFGVMSLLFLSVRAGLVAALCNLLPIFLNFGFMGLAGIPFNAATMMMGPLALGIAVDDTIHFMVRYQKNLRLVKDQAFAMNQAIRTEGRPIATTSFALAGGFLVLTMSEFVPSIHLGILAALVMLYALATELFVNPMILLKVPLITIWDYVALRISSPAVRQSLIFHGLSPREVKTVALLGGLRKDRKGEYLVKQGDPGDEMFLILSGRADVLLESDEGAPDKKLTSLAEGSLFGEMALLGEGIRTSSVVARTDMELLEIDDQALARCQRRNPRVAAKLFANISRVLVERIKGANLRVL